MSIEERLRWIEAYEASGSAGRVCARFGISRPTLRKWWRRYQESGQEGLADTSRRPASSPNRKVFAREEALIVALRKSEGLGVHKLKAELKRRHGLDLSAETILKALRRAGEPMKTRVEAAPAPERAAAGEARQFGRGGLFHGLASDDAAANAIASLIVAERYKPGQKLSEAHIGEKLGAGRTVVREALRRLAFAGIVTLHRNRGAFVADPSLGEVQQAYAARRLIEGEIVGDLCRHGTAHDVRALRKHVERQQAARDSGDRGRYIHLLTEFHSVLASLGENRLLEGFVQQLAAKTSLAVLLYDGAPPACAIEEHAALIDFIAAGDAQGAWELMNRHLAGHQGRLPARK
jgi:DNA-binding GntR family transcriptional regulator/transposase-like protein